MSKDGTSNVSRPSTMILPTPAAAGRREIFVRGVRLLASNTEPNEAPKRSAQRASAAGVKRLDVIGVRPGARTLA